LLLILVKGLARRRISVSRVRACARTLKKERARNRGRGSSFEMKEIAEAAKGAESAR